MEDEYRYCKDFCPLYQAIEDFNEHKHSWGDSFSCTDARIDCSYIEKLVRQNRGEGIDDKCINCRNWCNEFYHKDFNDKAYHEYSIKLDKCKTESEVVNEETN